MMEQNQTEQRQKLRKSMMGLLARREHSKLELQQKMQNRGFSDELISQNIENFAKQGWQSDFRYAEMLIRSRISKRHGPLKITMELKQKGLTDDIISLSMQIDVNWSEVARKALIKKYSSQPIVQNDKNKRYRFLQQRGFYNEQIKWALNNANSGFDDCR